MNRLKNKLFFTIFSIFTIFVISLIVVFNVRLYNREYSKINNSLNMINNNRFPRLNDYNQQMRFMDTIVYTVIINDNNEITKIISHREDNSVTDDIEYIVNNIINRKDNIYIGNLYTNKYSYKMNNNIITIVDNTNSINSLKEALYLSLFIFFLAEIVSGIISYILTNSIIKPVNESFIKQKEFIQDASHELKTPLAVIMASSDAYKKDKNMKWIENIDHESDRMSKLITNLLDLSKIENTNTVFENTNISKLVEKSSLTLESLMFEKNIKLDCNIEKDIMFDCNSDEIKELVSILLDNAIKHSSEKGNIKVSLSNEKNNIILEVKNKGEAIEKGEEEKIFERFYRADKSRNRSENRYGLGLAIAKNIVIKHNGEISAYSKDKYTTFKVIFKKK